MIQVELTQRQLDALLDVALNKASCMSVVDGGDSREHYALVGACQQLQQAKAASERMARRVPA